MKIKTFILLSAFTINSWALGGYESLSGDEKKITDKIKSTLQISNDDAFVVYEGIIKGQLDTKNWQYNTFDNNSLDSSKVAKSNNKTLHINFVTDNRYVNISLIKYDSENQILAQAIETLPRKSDVAINKYNELKKDSTTWTIDNDSPEFSAFSKKKSSARVKIMVNSGIGAIQYIDFYTININGQR